MPFLQMTSNALHKINGVGMSMNKGTLGCCRTSQFAKASSAAKTRAVSPAAIAPEAQPACVRAPAFEEYVLDLQQEIKAKAEAIEGSSGKVFVDDRQVHFLTMLVSLAISINQTWAKSAHLSMPN